ncbi:MAG: pyridoxal-dependent decarboxylase [Planctomycetota bacterium]|jgi:aromatic-L-amino-acid decarboxylase
MQHLTPAEFRRLGYRAVDWIASYAERVESMPVFPQREPGELLAALPERAPEDGGGAEAWDGIFSDLEQLILPALTHWQSPNFFAYFPCNASGPGILGELVSAGLGIQGMLWATSPAATELEFRMLSWLGRLLELPDELCDAPGGGCIQGTASEATLVALVAARQRVRQRTGARHGRLVAYTSSQAHSSVVKAAMIAGLCADASGGDALRFVAVDDEHALVPEALAAAIAEDREAGRVPFFVCATVGTTSSTAVDPLPAIGEVLHKSGFREIGGWLHVDAAYAGAACICPEHRPLLDGVEHADSFCFNPHKWLLTNFDCSAFWTRDRAALVDSLSVTPEYLRNRATEESGVIDYRDWQVPLGRRFRALKLWFVLRHYGAEGLRRHIRHHVKLAELFESLVRADDRFEVCAPRRLALVCFRRRSSDEDNRALLERVNRSGKVYLSHTALRGPDGAERLVLRLAIGAPGTEEHHVRAAWDLLRE